MAQALTGFSDADAWERCGNRIIARARNASYKEKLRSGLPIEYFLELDDSSEPEPETGQAQAAKTTPDFRPEFMEPVPSWHDYKLLRSYRFNYVRPSDDTQHISYEDRQAHDDFLDHYAMVYGWNWANTDPIDLIPEPSLRHHRKSRRIRKTNPKYEPKAQKNPKVQNRGKVRQISDDPVKVNKESAWSDMVEDFIDHTLIWALRRPGSYQPRYSYMNCIRIIRRFQSLLDPEIHTDICSISKFWENIKDSILTDYIPIPLLIIPENPRYFNGLFYEDLDTLTDEWEWDWIDRGPVRLFL